MQMQRQRFTILMLRIKGKVLEIGGKLKRLPSLFDLAVCGFMGLLLTIKIHKYHYEDVKKITLVFGIIALMLVAMMCKQRRTWRNWMISALAMWSMFHVFWHSWIGIKPSVQSFITAHINWTLLNEGFIYILFWVFGVWVIVSFSKSWKIYYGVVTLAIIVGISRSFDSYLGWSMTPLMSPILAGAIFMLINKRWKIALPVIVGGIGLTIYKWEWLLYKFVTRPIMWKIAIRDMLKEPWGHGWDHGINHMDGFVYSETGLGSGWIQGDLVELGKYLGVPAVIFTGLFFGYLLFKGKKNSLAYYLFLTAMIAGLFQRTMFFSVQTGVVLLAVSLLILESGLYGKLVKTKA